MHKPKKEDLVLEGAAAAEDVVLADVVVGGLADPEEAKIMDVAVVKDPDAGGNGVSMIMTWVTEFFPGVTVNMTTGDVAVTAGMVFESSANE